MMKLKMNLDIGKRLKKLRKDKGYTLKQLSEICGLSVSFISDIENSRRNPSIENLDKLATALTVSVNNFFDNNSKKEETFKHVGYDLSVVPKEFTNAKDAREYVSKHEIFGSNGFDANKLDDNEILEFANELLKQMELISFKYKK